MRIFNTLYKKSFYVALALLGAACNSEVSNFDIDKEEIPTFEKVTPPGPDYEKQGESCLNVFYCIPSDLDTIADWHRRLSGITLHAQKFLKENYELAGLEPKTFNLCVNKQSEHYIKITLLRLDIASANSTNMTQLVANSVRDYMFENEEDFLGNNTLVYMPSFRVSSGGRAPFNGTYNYSTSNNPIPDMGYAVIACDREDFDIRYLNTSAGTAFLGEVGAVIHEIGHAMFLQHNEILEEDTHVGIMGNGMFSYNVHKNTGAYFSMADLLWMQELDVFKPAKQEILFNYKPKVTFNEVTFENIADSIKIVCNFTADHNPVMFMVYNDPWLSSNERDDEANNSFTEYDAYSYATDTITENDGTYTVTMTIPWLATYNMLGHKKGEMRFRIAFEGGVTYPVVYGAPGLKGEKDVRHYYRVPADKPVFDEKN